MRPRLLVLVLMAGATLTACGGGPGASVASLGKTGPTTTAMPSGPAGTGVPQAKVLAFVSCLRAHGLPTFPDPLPGGGFSRTALGSIDQGSAQFQAAEKACRALAIATGFEHTPAEIAEHVRQELAESACLRKHGVTDPPEPNAQGTMVFPSGANPRQARFQAAQKICAYLNP